MNCIWLPCFCTTNFGPKHTQLCCFLPYLFAPECLLDRWTRTLAQVTYNRKIPNHVRLQINKIYERIPAKLAANNTTQNIQESMVKGLVEIKNENPKD